MKTTLENKELNKIFTIPNILSAVRILMIPVFFWLYLVKKDYLTATILILFSGLTDVVDGYIARTFNQISKIGKVLDPTADKLTQAAVLIALTLRFDYILIVFLVLALKECVMLLLGMVLYKHTKILIGSKWHGKLAASIIYLMLLTHLIWGISATIPPVISYVTSMLAVLGMIFSLLMYLKDYLYLYKEHNIIDEK